MRPIGDPSSARKAAESQAAIRQLQRRPAPAAAPVAVFRANIEDFTVASNVHPNLVDFTGGDTEGFQADGILEMQAEGLMGAQTIHALVQGIYLVELTIRWSPEENSGRYANVQPSRYPDSSQTWFPSYNLGFREIAVQMLERGYSGTTFRTSAAGFVIVQALQEAPLALNANVDINVFFSPAGGALWDETIDVDFCVARISDIGPTIPG